MPAEWSEQAPGVWSRAFGTPGDIRPGSLLDVPPRREALAALPAVPFPFAATAVETERVGGRLVIRLPLAPKVPVFGMGLQFFAINQRGRTRRLRVNSDPRQDTGESHAPLPFFVTGDGYAVLVDSARIVTIRCGAALRHPPAGSAEWVEIELAGAGADVLVFGGPTPLDAVRRYNLFSGGGCLPPRWGLGFWHRTPLRYSAREVLEEAGEYRRRGIPCDVIGLEPGWQTAAYPCSYEWSPERFPDPDAFLRELSAQGFTLNIWEHPWVSPRSSLHAPLAPLSGSHTVWSGLAPDYTLPEVRELVTDQHRREHVERGVAGYKLDECDGGELTGQSWMFPAHATFPSGHDGEELRQVYGLLLQRLTAGLFWERGRRTYGLVRASAAGAAPLPYVLYTDLYDHRQYVRALCNATFSGLLFTPEVRSADTPEEWLRRVQVACLSPLAMLDAWSSGTKPWSYPEVEGAVRHWIELRMRLLPYLYSAFARYALDGTPPFRAMALETGGEAALCDDQFMVGDDLLVAPLFAGETERRVLLPPGAWYDFETGERLPGGACTLACPPEAMPLLVREGAVVPLMPPLARTPRAPDTVALEVRHYGHVPGHFRLYDDDGESLAYQAGRFRWLELRVEVGEGGVRRGSVEAGPPVGGLHYDPVDWRFLG